MLIDTLPTRRRSTTLSDISNPFGLYWRSAYSGIQCFQEPGTIVGSLGEKVIFDEQYPRKGWKPCVARQTTYSYEPCKFSMKGPTGPGDYTTGKRCGHPGGDMYWGYFYPSAAYLPPNVTDDPYDYVKRKEVQDALSVVLNEYYRALYNVAHDLPDMTVFLKELGDFKRVWQDIRAMANGLATLCETWAGRTRTRMYTPSANVRDIRRRHQIAKARVLNPEHVPNAFVGINFGVLAPIRDITAIISTILAKIKALLPDGEVRKDHFRRTVLYTETLQSASPRGGQCWGYSCYEWPPKPEISRSLEIKPVITCRYSSTFTGSSIEQALAAALAMVGALPNVESLWEMTRLSWLVDYFFRVDKLLRRCGLFSMSAKQSVILNQSSSMHFVQTTTAKWPDAPCYKGMCITREDEYYERAIDVQPLTPGFNLSSLERLLSYVSYPNLKEAGLAASVAVQLLSRRPR